MHKKNCTAVRGGWRMSLGQGEWPRLVPRDRLWAAGRGMQGWVAPGWAGLAPPLNGQRALGGEQAGSPSLSARAHTHTHVHVHTHVNMRWAGAQGVQGPALDSTPAICKQGARPPGGGPQLPLPQWKPRQGPTPALTPAAAWGTPAHVHPTTANGLFGLVAPGQPPLQQGSGLLTQHAPS